MRERMKPPELPICADCQFSKAIDTSKAYCKKKCVMVRLGQEACEMFKNGVARYRDTGYRRTAS